VQILYVSHLILFPKEEKKKTDQKIQTVSALKSFFLVLTLYPDVQRKAQEEIDRVVGVDRLPSYDDRGNLPYIDALVKEVLRWHPIAPMGLPHATDEDDVVNGYLIPKGAMLLANIWYVQRLWGRIEPRELEF
jgi:cytochrome P450